MTADATPPVDGSGTTEEPPVANSTDASDAPEDATGAGDHPNADVKTAPDGTPIERTTPPEQWEAVGRRALATLLRHRRDDVLREVDELVSAIEFGAPVSVDHVRNLRHAIEALEVVVEADLADLVDDVDAWERTAERIPDDALLGELGIDRDELERLADRGAVDDGVGEAGSG